MITENIKLDVPKFQVEAILAALPYPEQKLKRKLLKDAHGWDTINRMRKAVCGDEYTPKADTLRDIATILGVSMDALYTRITE